MNPDARRPGTALPSLPGFPTSPRLGAGGGENEGGGVRHPPHPAASKRSLVALGPATCHAAKGLIEADASDHAPWPLAVTAATRNKWP